MTKSLQPSDQFVSSRLPADTDLPVFLSEMKAYPDALNAGYELSDALVEAGLGGNTALIGNGRQRTYAELAAWTDQLACALIKEYNVVPGARILIRSPNTPAMVACWIAVMKAGAIAVNTMPLLRAAELQAIIDKAQITSALCDMRLLEELLQCQVGQSPLKQLIGFDGGHTQLGELDRAALGVDKTLKLPVTHADDPALIAFTSGTTGVPKGAIHRHKDLLSIADGYGRHILHVSSNDICIGSPPLAFTFGLGGLAIFPLRFGATAALFEDAAPKVLLENISAVKATLCFTAPTAYKVILEDADAARKLESVRIAVSAGEPLPEQLFQQWEEETDIPMLDGIGTTELLHIFISNRIEDRRAGCLGRPVPGYVAKLFDAKMDEVVAGEPGMLAVRGPTGCCYLDDPRQRDYVKNGWNFTGDVCRIDSDGRFYFLARSDDMIISSGYNIPSPEVEAALLKHPYVTECAVVGLPDQARGQLVTAFVVLKEGYSPSQTIRLELQDHVKSTIAPYKYPRTIHFVDTLPKTQTGKVQRFRLKGHRPK